MHHTLDLGFPFRTVLCLDMSLQVGFEPERLLRAVLVRAFSAFVVDTIDVLAVVL